jgi:hypothetical protein
VVGAVLLAIGVSAGAYLLRDHARDCGGPTLAITVEAAPDIAPALSEVAERFNTQTHEVGGGCVRVAIAVRDPAVVAAKSGRIAADAWVPDSSMWLARAADAGARPVGKGNPLATTPVVIAAPRVVADELRRRKILATSWRILGRPPLRALVRALDPERNAAGAATTIAAHPVIGSAVVRREPDPARLFALFGGVRDLRRPLVAATEQSVVAYNDTHRPNPAEVLVPSEGTILMDHPLATTTTDPHRAEAVDAFRWVLRAQQAVDTFQRYGFRRPDGRFTREYAAWLGLRQTLPKILAEPTEAEVTATMGA